MKKTITLSIDEDLNTALDRIRGETGMTKSLIVERGIKMVLERYGKGFHDMKFGDFIKEFVSDARYK